MLVVELSAQARRRFIVMKHIKSIFKMGSKGSTQLHGSSLDLSTGSFKKCDENTADSNQIQVSRRDSAENMPTVKSKRKSLKQFEISQLPALVETNSQDKRQSKNEPTTCTLLATNESDRLYWVTDNSSKSTQNTIPPSIIVGPHYSQDLQHSWENTASVSSSSTADHTADRSLQNNAMHPAGLHAHINSPSDSVNFEQDIVHYRFKVAKLTSNGQLKEPASPIQDKSFGNFESRLQKVELQVEEVQQEVSVIHDKVDKIMHIIQEDQARKNQQEQKLSRLQRRICILCKNQPFLDHAEGCIRELARTWDNKQHFIITSQKIHTVQVKKEDFQGADWVILLAVPEPRNLIISETEPSQLGVAFRVAKIYKKKILLILITESKEKLPPSELLHPTCLSTISEQSELKLLYKNRQIISVAFNIYGEEKMALSSVQENVLKDWLQLEK